MDEKRIEEIVLRVFEKAKKEHASHSRFALSKHIGEHSDLSSKTLERAYDRYIKKDKSKGAPQAESVDLLCKYLGREGYADYIREYIDSKEDGPDETPEDLNESSVRGNWPKILIIISVMILTTLMFYNWQVEFTPEISKRNECMAWADSVYVEVSCATRPYSKYGTRVEPLDPMKLENFKKVKVSMATQFFAKETNKPLIWYYKNKDEEIEYFTAPGLHPINRETLRKITEDIIQRYVPIHVERADSFVQ